MYDLTNFTLRDMTICGAALRKCGAGAGSLDEVAQRIVRLLYDQLGDATGNRACPLVRFFLTRAHAQLPADLQARVHADLGAEPPPDLNCLVLLGSAGDQPEWDDPQRSARHRVIPLAGTDLPGRFPMVAQMVAAFGLGLPGLTLAPDPGQKGFGVFHVTDAAGSPWVPDQGDFVTRHGIRSVLGFGSLLSAADLFAVLLFARVAIPRQTADLFHILALNAKLALLPSPGPGRPGPGTTAAEAAELVLA